MSATETPVRIDKIVCIGKTKREGFVYCTVMDRRFDASIFGELRFDGEPCSFRDAKAILA